MGATEGPTRRAAVSAALASERLPGLLAGAARLLVNGFWLGVLSDESLRALDERYYARTDLYRTEEWNQRGLFEWEERLVHEHLTGCATVVVPAAGGGREVLALVEAGFDAVGYESHPGLVAFGQSFLAARGHDGRISQSVRDEFPSIERPGDGVLVGWGAYSLIHGRDRRIGFLAGARRVLPVGAPLLLSFFDRTAESRELSRTATLANALRRLRGRRPLEVGDTLAPNLVHVFTRTQIIGEVEAAGFDLVSYELVQAIDETTRYAGAALRAA